MKTSKKIPSILILFSGIFLFAFSFSDAQLIPVDAQEFRQAPDYKAIALDGTPVSITDYQGKTILVNLWATWCEPCREEMPALGELHSMFPRSDFEIIGVSIDDPGFEQVIVQTMAEDNLTYPVWLDPENRFQFAFRTIGVPESFLIDADGQIIHQWKGAFDPVSDDTINLVESTDCFVKVGRGKDQNTRLSDVRPCVMKWDHKAPNDVRIDPSISNVVEMLVLTNSYYADVQKYINVPGTVYPLAPTSDNLSNEFQNLENFKNASDTLVYKSAEFKLLFGADAEATDQAKFRIVKLAGSTMSDNEIKSKVIAAFNTFFAIENWEFGETFYFTELAAYVHKELAGVLSSFVIVPQGAGSVFGDMFEYTPNTDELIIPDVDIDDIDIITNITDANIKAGS